MSDIAPNAPGHELDRIQNLLFHLAKALWKTVPVVGPFVEELVFAQFEGALRAKTDDVLRGLAQPQLDALIASLPSKEQLERVEEIASQLGWEQRLQVARNQADLLGAVANGFEGVNLGFGRLEDLLRELGDDMATDAELKERLSRVERARVAWMERISSSQLQLLSIIPREPMSVLSLWQMAKAQFLPDSSELEFRFRLHELEWLGLVSRKRDEAGQRDWLYWRPAPP